MRVDSNSPPRYRQRLIWLFKLIVLLLVAWGIYHTVRRGWDDLKDYSWQVDWTWLLAAGALYVVGLLPSAFFWHRILAALGQHPSLLATLRAYFLGHLGKYVPGKAMVILLRTGALRGARTNTALVAASVLLETLTMMATGAAISAVYLVLREGWRQPLAWLAAAMLLAVIVPTLPPVFRTIVRRMPNRWTGDVDQLDLRRIGYPLMIGGWVSVSVGWSLLGLSLWAVLRSLGAANVSWPGDWPLLTAAVSLAVVAGFISLIPGGAGVRDWILAVLMIPAFGTATALISAFVLRLVWLMSELAISGILYRAKPTSPDAPTTAAGVHDQLLTD